MNKLKTDINGKFPFFLDDFRWMDESLGGLRTAFEAVFAAYSEQFIISGCELTFNPLTGYYDCTTGFIYFDGEILLVPEARALSDETHTPVFDLEVTYDLAGLKLFGSGVYHDTYEIRRGKFYSVAPENTGGKLIAITAQRLFELMGEKLAEIGEWHIPGADGEPELLDNWVSQNSGSYSALAFKKDAFGNVWLRGQAISPNPTTHEVFTLPSGFRPQRARYFIGNYLNSDGSFTHTNVVVSSNGNVSAPDQDQDIISLDGIVFSTD
jgi:hypothetical protein